MTSTQESTGTNALTLGQIVGDCYTRSKVWIDWLCHPEGPSLLRFFRDLFLLVLGLALFVLGIVMLFVPDDWNVFSVDGRYMGVSLVLLGWTFYIVGKHYRRVELNTAAYLEEIDALLSGVEQGLDKVKDNEKTKCAQDEIRRLKFFKEKPSEVSYLRLTPLRRIQVHTYSDTEMIAQGAIVNRCVNSLRRLSFPLTSFARQLHL